MMRMQIIGWAQVAFTLPFLCFRYFVRLNVLKRLYVDDLLVLLAWISLLASQTILQIYVSGVYRLWAMLSSDLPPSAPILIYFQSFRRASIASSLLSHVCLWCVKLNFLFFFKRLGFHVRHQEKIWWLVLLFTMAGWVGCVGLMPWRCLAGDPQDSFGETFPILRNNGANSRQANLTSELYQRFRRRIQQSLGPLICLYRHIVGHCYSCLALHDSLEGKARSEEEARTWRYLWTHNFHYPGRGCTHHLDQQR